MSSLPCVRCFGRHAECERGESPPCASCRRKKHGIGRCVEIPPPFREEVGNLVSRSTRRGRVGGSNARLRKELCKRITQWRKSHGQTVATALAAPTMVVELQRQLDAANERIKELEGMNEILEGELESMREHEELAEENDESSREGIESDADSAEPSEESIDDYIMGDDPAGDALAAALEGWEDSSAEASTHSS